MRKKKWLAMLLTAMMVIVAIPATSFAANEAKGSLVNAYLANDNLGGRITVDLENVTFNDSVVLELFSDKDVLLTTTKLNTNLDVKPGTHVDLTGAIGVTFKDEYWVSTEWQPHDSMVPKYVKLLVDGKYMGSVDIKTDQTILGGIPITAKDWAKFPGTAGAIVNHAWLYVDGNRVTVDMSNVLFKENLVLQLLSGDKVLTESTLNQKIVTPGAYQELTGGLLYKGTDEAWIQAPWTPNDKDVPDKVKVIVDGLEVATHSIYNAPVEHNQKLITAKDWHDLPVTECVFDQWGYDADGHWKACACNKTTEKEKHNFGEWTIVESATPDSEGLKEHTCADCGYIERDVIPAHVHKDELTGKKDATCSAEGYTGDKVCKICGEVLEKGKAIDKLDHKFKDGKCTVCGAKDPAYKPAKPDTPKTGDYTNMALLLALLSVAGLGVIGTKAYNRKK